MAGTELSEVVGLGYVATGDASPTTAVGPTARPSGRRVLCSRSTGPAAAKTLENGHDARRLAARGRLPDAASQACNARHGAHPTHPPHAHHDRRTPPAAPRKCKAAVHAQPWLGTAAARASLRPHPQSIHVLTRPPPSRVLPGPPAPPRLPINRVRPPAFEDAEEKNARVGPLPLPATARRATCRHRIAPPILFHPATDRMRPHRRHAAGGPWTAVRRGGWWWWWGGASLAPPSPVRRRPQRRSRTNGAADERQN